MRGADPLSFTVLLVADSSSQILNVAKDRSHVYINCSALPNNSISSIDLPSFSNAEETPAEFEGGPEGYYYKDKRHVYYLNCPNAYTQGCSFNIIQGADPTAFVISISYYSVPEYDARDKNSYYLVGTVVGSTSGP